MKVLVKFEGIVDEVLEDTFYTRLYDLTVPANPLELAEIYKWAVPKEDHDLIVEGAVFYWTISRQGRKSISEIKFVKPTPVFALSLQHKKLVDRFCLLFRHVPPPLDWQI